MTRSVSRWMLQFGSVCLALLAVATSPLLAYRGPTPKEPCDVACDRWAENGYNECANAKDKAACNADLAKKCKENCDNKTCPTSFSCDNKSASPTPGGPTGTGCRVATADEGKLSKSLCTNGCYENGACAACQCTDPSGYGQMCACR
jgi:hypothetical protein